MTREMVSGKSFLLLSILLASAHCVIDQCKNYKILPRDSERSKDYATPAGAKHPCDDVEDGWYKFASGDIATSCVPSEHCGTKSTVWMRDPIPKIGETKVNDFCVNNKPSTSGTCCLFALSINVTNCNGFMVYYFKKDDLLCPSGYCTGDLKACPNGQSSASGYEPCAVSYPAMTGPPTLSPPTIVNNGHDFQQSCTIHYSASELGATFDINWYFDDVAFKKKTVASIGNNKLQDVITSSDWKGHIGQTLTCGVVPFFITKTERGKETFSTAYHGAIKVTPDPVTLTEGGEVQLTLTSTLPTVCAKVDSSACKMDLVPAVTHGNRDHIFMKGSCKSQFSFSDWDPATNQAIANVTVSIVIDTMVRQDTSYSIAFRVLPDILGHDIWDTYNMDSVNITVHDAAHEVCMIFGDPKLINLQRQFLLMANSKFELIRLYDAVNSDGKRLEVEARMWHANNDADAVCGVSVAYEDTLVKVDMCTQTVGKSAPILSRAGKNPDALEVYSCGAEFEILTSDGVRVTIIAHDLNLDVKIHLPPTFHGKDKGLCSYSGSHTIPKDSELPAYAATRMGSLFLTRVNTFINMQSAVSDPSSWYCSCGTVNGDCHPFQRVQYPRAPVSVDNAGKSSLRAGCRQSFPKTPSVSTLDLRFASHGSLRPQPSQSELKVISETCKGYIMNYSSPFCLRENAANIPTYVDACTLDHRGSGDYSYIDSTLQAFEWSCEESILKNDTYYTGTLGNEVAPTEVTSSLCPNACSRAGTCTNGTCKCFPGNFGPDCSITDNATPIVFGIAGGPICVIPSDNCNNPAIVARNVLDANNLRAKLIPLEFHYGRPVPTNKSFEIPAVLENRYSVSVPLSAFVKTLKDQTVYRIDLQLTDDGKTFTSKIPYLVYDTRCHYCNILLGGCYERENACKIDGQCYLSAEKNPADPQEICDPNKALMSWTKVADSSIPVAIG